MNRAQMRAEKMAREDRFSRRRTYRFASHYQRQVAETVSRIVTDVKSSTIKRGRCNDCGAKGYQSRDCPRKDENKISRNKTSVLGEFKIEMKAKINKKKLSKISSHVGRLKSQVSEWEGIGANKYIV